MSYYGLGQPGQWTQSVLFPGFPGGLPGATPGPGAPGIPPGTPVPATPAALFPTNVSWGDVVNVTGPFAGLHQGQVRVKFAGVPYQAVALTSGYGGSVVVPDGAQTGACMIEVNGRTVFSANCVVTKRTGSYGQRVRAVEHPKTQSWKNFGPSTALMGDDMSYSNDGTEYTRGIGAIAAESPSESPAAASIATRQIGSDPQTTTVRLTTAEPSEPDILGVTSPIPTTVSTDQRLAGAVVRYGVKINPQTGQVMTAQQAGSTTGPAPATQIGTGIGTPATCGRRPRAREGYELVCRKGKWMYRRAGARSAPPTNGGVQAAPIVAAPFAPKKKFPLVPVLVLGGIGVAAYLILRKR